MHNLTKSFLLIVISFFGLIGCKTSTLTQVDKVIAPRYQLPSHLNSIALIDRSVEKTGFSNSMKDVITPADQARIDYINAIKSGLPVSSKKVLSPLNEGRKDGVAEKMDQKRLQEIAGNMVGVLSLEQFEFSETRTYKDIKKSQLDPYGKKYTIIAVSGKREISLKTYWRLYEVKSGTVLLTFPQYTENTYETEGLDRQSVNLQMDTTEVVTASTLGRKLSAVFIRDINPEEIKSYWDFYVKGDEIVKNSGKLIKKSDFRNAVEYLTSNIGSIEKQKNISRANHNLIIAYYFNDQRDKALRLAAYQYNLTGRYEFKELYDKMYTR